MTKILLETKKGISWKNKNLSRQHKITYMYAPNDSRVLKYIN